MKGEFKVGDIIIQIDGNFTYMVDYIYVSLPWYRLVYVAGETSLHNIDREISWIDKNFVKVDHVISWNENKIVEKLSKLDRTIIKNGII